MATFTEHRRYGRHWSSHSLGGIEECPLSKTAWIGLMGISNSGQELPACDPSQIVRQATLRRSGSGRSGYLPHLTRLCCEIHRSLIAAASADDAVNLSMNHGQHPGAAIDTTAAIHQVHEPFSR